MSKPIKTLRERLSERLSRAFTRKSRQGNYDMNILNDEMAKGLRDKEETIRKILTAPDFDPRAEPGFEKLSSETLIKQMLEIKKKKIQRKLIDSDFALIIETDFEKLSTNDIINKMLEKKKAKLQSSLNPYEFDLISEPDFERLSASEIKRRAKKRATLRKKITKRESSRRINTFFKKTTLRRKLNYIKLRCNAPNVCMALGIYTDYIKTHFNNFTDFIFATDIELIGKPSANGFVNLITYTNGNTSSTQQSKARARTRALASATRSLASATRSLASATRSLASDRASANALSSASALSSARALSSALYDPVSLQDFNAYAILKSNLNRKSDNLLYEYMVGLYLNTLNKRFPCFLETYSYYTYVNEKLWESLQNNYSINKTNVQKSLQLNLTQQSLKYTDVTDVEIMKDVYDTACLAGEKQLRQAILIQYFNNVITLKSFIEKKRDDNFEIINILFQVYFPLAHLKDTFTHYDLHTDNVLLYTPDENKYIEYHYHEGASTSTAGPSTSTFKSKYMVKIIDYGRCFFKDDANNFGSESIYKSIETNHAECNEAGFDSLFVINDINIVKYSTSRFRNSSTDLVLLYHLKKYFNYRLWNTDIRKLFNDVIFKGINHFYTPEPDHIAVAPGISTVNDAYLRIKELLVENEDYNNNTYYDNKTKLGDLHIYADGREMEYIEFNESTI